MYIGSDHGGFDLKQELCKFLSQISYGVIDAGPSTPTPMDYPDMAIKVCRQLQSEPDAKGILICGSGIGMSIAANKMKGIRAALCSEPLSAKLSREHNNANVLCMGARMIGLEMAKEIAKVFLESHFAEDRHIRRIEKICKIEE